MEEKKKIKIIFHKEDCDGVGSAALIAYHIRQLGECEIEFEGVSHNDITRMEEKLDVSEWLDEYDAIYMTDISFSLDTLSDIYAAAYQKKFIWFDHHKPIIEKADRHCLNYFVGLRDYTHSAIYNVWSYFNDWKDEEPPLLIKWISALDNWTWKEEGLDYFELSALDSGLKKMSDLNPVWWLDNMENLLGINEYSDIIQEAIEIGEEIVAEKRKKNKKMCDVAVDTSWTVGPDNRSAGCVVLYGGSESMMFESISDQVKNAIVMRRLKDSGWAFSLYNVKDDATFHCGQYLLNTYGGGGHEGAAGCTVSEDEFINILKNKHL